MTDNFFPEFTGRTPVARAKPVGFKLNGYMFKCADEQPGGVWRRVTGDVVPTSGAIAFIEGCIAEDEDVLRFREFLDSKQVIVDGTLLGEIMLSLISQYGERPTLPSSDASVGSPAISDGSQDGALTVVSS